MVKVNVNVLQGAALDYWVAKAWGVEFLREWPKFDYTPDYVGYVLGDDGRIVSWHFDGQCSRAGHWKEEDVYSPSTNWSQGGPIIEREKIMINYIHSLAHLKNEFPKGYWCANGNFRSHTPLTAAMRCYVASKLGDVVEIPDELV